uniref:Conserved oligomeric Golgi complex subunit 8 n=1 Tax=Steinernema glaseri TaxID=37863 RepID=A0A1I8ARL9_9BILA
MRTIGDLSDVRRHFDFDATMSEVMGCWMRGVSSSSGQTGVVGGEEGVREMAAGSLGDLISMPAVFLRVCRTLKSHLEEVQPHAIMSLDCRDFRDFLCDAEGAHSSDAREVGMEVSDKRGIKLRAGIVSLSIRARVLEGQVQKSKLNVTK